MSSHKRVNRCYIKVSSGMLLDYLKNEGPLQSDDALSGYTELTSFDLRSDVCFLVKIDSRTVGFACFKNTAARTGSRELTKIWINPSFRKHGCASFTIRGLGITRASINLRHVDLIRLCQALGFTAHAQQDYPKSLIQLQATSLVGKGYGT